MGSLKRTIIVMLTTFGASVLGMLLQALVPTQMLTESKGTVGAMVGLVTLLLALVLGFLVYTAFAVFATQQSEAQSLGPVVIEIDVALERYGDAAANGRAGLRAALERSRVRFFGDVHHGPRPWTLEETRATLRGLAGYFDSLKPETETQRQSLDAARDLTKRFNETQMLMARQLENPFPPYVLLVVVCWASVLFFGNGLVATVNAVTVIAHLAGAAAVGSAIFLILELSQPYTGFLRLSSVGIDKLLQVLAAAEAKRAES
jgi:positive regulator of sigma E activity